MPPATINEITKQWQLFYGALAGVTATLMGLLFVSITLHANKIHEEENTHFLRLARLTFSNYLMLLVLALQMLVPIYTLWQVTTPIVAVGFLGLFWTFKLRSSSEDRGDPNVQFLRRSFRMSIMTNVMLLFIGWFLFTNPEVALYFLLTPVLILMVNNVRNSWGLLMMLRYR